MKVALYLRVSTDGQTVENQRRELAGWADHFGHEVVETYVDAGVSGAKSEAARPALAALMADARRGRFQIVGVWALDRLGRDLGDLIDLVDRLRSAKVGLFSHREVIDTTTPGGELTFHIFGALAQFERARLAERIKAGMARAKDAGTKSGRPIGNPPLPGLERDAIRDLLAQGVSIRKTAKALGVSPTTVQKYAG